MNNKRVSSVTLTILTESPVALSNDQSFGTYTPIKKYFYKDGRHAMTSVPTVTYELRKSLICSGKLSPDSIVIKSKNLHPKELGIESDVFGYLIPKNKENKQQSKTSPIRIIPFISVHTFKNDTQLITNRGYLDINLGREYYEEKGKELKRIAIEEVIKTQALAYEEVFGDYYTYTVTLELDRIGVIETDEKGNRLPIDKRVYFDEKDRKEIVKNILTALIEFTRQIKHQTVHLKPLAVFGGAFPKVIPYFWNDIEFDEYQNVLILDNIKNTIEDYDLNDGNGYLITAVDRRIRVKNEDKYRGEGLDIRGKTPVKAIKELIEKLELKDNKWYLKE
ncbi:type I-B CRISPR-associated protein Cas7/Cst2/DevR [Caloranaerobacter sp. DY30410]|uniref:type I-B CRISPR-associated protein Cas7/Cst2/DevR n=1 Tax=Caloranaerobacter sp. DY30410 TaxID=3238305 RepID=UPI003D044057